MAINLKNVAKGLLYNLALIVSDIHISENNLEELCIKMVNTFKMNSSEELTFRNFVCELVNRKV
tara:strand:- start:238 stop:429 length:192 start_codon:yes stop_codon:yes gene_type:complete